MTRAYFSRLARESLGRIRAIAERSRTIPPVDPVVRVLEQLASLTQEERARLAIVAVHAERAEIRHQNVNEPHEETSHGPSAPN